MNSLRPSKSSPKLLFLADTLGVGGAERSVLNLIPGLITLGYVCEIASLMPPYTLATEFESLGVKVHRMTLSHRWNVIEAVFKVCRLLRRGSYDVIFSIVFFSPNYAALSRFFVPYGIRVASLQGMEFERDEFSTLWMKFRKIWRITLLKCFTDAIVTASNPIREHYQDYLGKKQMSVVPNSVSKAAFRHRSPESNKVLRQKYGISEQDFLLISPARFIPEKGHTYLIDALKLLSDRGVHPKALFFGFGENEQNLKRQIENQGLNSQIVVSPPLGQLNLFSMIQASDLFVLASTSEGFGLAIAEAAGLGMPILTTSVGGIKEVVEDERSAILVPSRSPQKLANAIERLMLDPDLRARLATQAKSRSQSLFSEEAVIAQMDKFLKDLLAKHEESKPRFFLRPVRN